jgi:tetratricopeptide (TPR) repeat protein
MKRIILLAALALLPASPLFAAVTVSEEQVVIPTYLIGPPDPNPQFYFGGNSQGAQHRIYPYPVYDNLTTEKADKSYTMVYLENEYIKIGILPEIGGKIFEAIDKTNGYNFFYRQHVIKPALISLLGAWISGGVEWDVPHHHRATSFLPVQYKIEDGADGAKTVWVGELELRDRMRWAVGMTLHPGKSYLQADFRMINRTPVPTSMLCFSNAAVSVNDTYQVIFPPSTQHVTYHGKRDFTTWPIATTVFNGADFTAGVDVSWYKNHYNAMSMFAWNYQDDFLAGYDHGKNAGTMAIADHNVVPGKKFWTWGNGPSGRGEDTLLTDHDGPYIELMVGAYSDNQPDYTWLQPFETRSWTQYWYPFRGIDGAKNANTEAAVNLDVNGSTARAGFYTTSSHPSAVVTVTLRDQVLLREQTAIDPGSPYVKQIALPAGADPHDLRAAISADGRELVAYTPVRLQPEAMPADVTNPLPPAEIKTNEELYLTGLRIEQFHAPGALPDPYWSEALKRDPGDIRVNTALGIDAVKAGRFADAEAFLRKALARATDKYTSPKDGEPFYYLGMALAAQGKTDEAFTQFYKSTWSAAWRSPGYFQLAQIACARGDFDAAGAYDDRALAADATNTRALALRSAILRHEGKNDQALAASAQVAAIDPLDVDAMAEQWLADKSAASAQRLFAATNAFPATALEAAVDDMNAGLWSDATDLLTQAAAAAPDPAKVSPLVYYDLEFCAGKLNQLRKAREYARLAQAAPPDYVFPFQREMIAVLESAIEANPADSRAPYYLGNLLYDWQPERAVSLWEKSVQLGADFPVVYRNLALVQTRGGDATATIQAELEKAVEFGGNAMVFNDLDHLYEQEGVSPDKRLSLLELHEPVINRDDIIARQINLDIFAGRYDAAIALLQSRFFRAWEGGGRFSLGDSWINAHILRGRQRLAARQFIDALADFAAAEQMPANLQDATGSVAGRAAEISYWIGVADESLGDAAGAKKSFQEAASAPANPIPAGGRGFLGRGRGQMGGLGPGVHVTQAALYYQGLALAKFGDTAKATALFQQLAAAGGNAAGDAPITAASTAAQRAAVADRHYVSGLGDLGLGNPDKARQEFALALAASPDHLGAKVGMEDAGRGGR